MSGSVVMIHGAFAGGWCFDDFRRPFEARDWHTTVPDLPGHGGPLPAEEHGALAGLGLRDYADALERHIRAQAPAGDTVLLGHSMGGLLAQMLAARGLARGLILLAPAAPWGILPSSHDEIAAATGLMSLGDFWTRQLLPVFEVAAENSLNCLSPERQRAVFARFGAESGRALFEMLFWMFDPDAASHVNAVKVDYPVLCIAGGGDRLIAPATVRQIATRYAAVATLEEFEAMGHMLPLEDGSDAVAKVCLDWLAANLD